MKKYRGYYIDGVRFASKSDIDAFIKGQKIDRLRMLVSMMLKATSVEDHITIGEEIDRAAKYLVRYCHMDWGNVDAMIDNMFISA